jgi:DNA-binding XRE family transcriptional regulator
MGSGTLAGVWKESRHHARFVENMARVRRFRDLNQEQLAAMIGVKRTVIRDVEAEKRGLQLAEAAAIAEALEIPLDLMCGEQPLTLTVVAAPAGAAANPHR